MLTQISNQLIKKTRRKLISSWINKPLAELKSPIEQYYRNAIYCSHILTQEGQTLKSTYCNCRTCLTCNGIRTAKYINWYGKQVMLLHEPQLLTLTAPTVHAIEPNTLKQEIKNRETAWRKIYNNGKMQKINLKGIKALEVVPRPNDHFHPHFHFVIESQQNAQWILSQWLKHFRNANPQAQDLRPITSKDGLLEVFKYGTKFITERNELQLDGSFKKVPIKVKPTTTDLIIQALRNKPLVATFGGISKLKDEDVNELVEHFSYQELADVETQIWRWIDELDWVNTDTGEVLSGYQPTQNLKKVFK